MRNRAIILNLSPKDCLAVLTGEKNLLFYKNFPKLNDGFKVYLYCSTDGTSLYGNKEAVVTDSRDLLNKKSKSTLRSTTGFHKLNGLVVGEGSCKFAGHFPCHIGTDRQYFVPDPILSKSGWTPERLKKYGKGKKVYGWTIENVRVYDNSLLLNTFYRKEKKDFLVCPLMTPPKPWCYVVEKEEV